MISCLHGNTFPYDVVNVLFLTILPSGQLLSFPHPTNAFDTCAGGAYKNNWMLLYIRNDKVVYRQASAACQS